MYFLFYLNNPFILSQIVTFFSVLVGVLSSVLDSIPSITKINLVSPSILSFPAKESYSLLRLLNVSTFLTTLLTLLLIRLVNLLIPSLL